MPDFDELGVADHLRRALAAEQIAAPSAFEQHVIPPLLAGSDLLGIAPPAADRLRAFVLPVLQRLGAPMIRALPKEPRALVLVGDSEDAQTIGLLFERCSQFAAVRHAVAADGGSFNRQVRELRSPVEVLVATPRRLRELLRQKMVLLRGIEIVVFEAVDSLLERFHDLGHVVASLPGRPQTVAFAAAATPAVRAFGGECMRSPIVVGSSAGKVRRAKTRTLPVAPQAPAGKAGVRPAKSGHTDKIELPAWLDEAPRLELPAWLDEPQPEPAAAPASAPPPAAPARKPAGKKPKRKGAGKAGGKKQKRRP